MAVTDIKMSIEAEKLGIVFENLNEQTQVALQDAIAGIAKATYASMIRMSTERLKTLQKEYQRGLKYYVEGDTHIIELSPLANYIEDGWNRFDMKNPPNGRGFFKHNKFKIGKDGTRYLTIPFQHRSSGRSGISNMNQDLLQQELNQMIKKHAMRKLFKNSGGKALEGKVASVPHDPEAHRYLQGLTKYQKDYAKKREGGYFTFRRVSEKTEASKWWHPGFKGARIFRDVEKHLRDDVDQAIMDALKG